MATAQQSFIIKKNAGGNFVPMTEGLHPAVVGEVKDLGVIEGVYGAQHKFVFRYVNAAGAEASRFYSPSIDQKANLFKDYNSFVDMTGEDFNIYSLLGQQVQVFVTQSTNGQGLPKAKVEKVLKPAPGQKVPMPAGKTATAASPATGAKKPAASVKATSAKTKKAAEDQAALAGTEITDDDIPF